MKVDDTQFGFMPGKSTTYALYILRRMQEEFREREKAVHVFRDLEKAFDRVFYGAPFVNTDLCDDICLFKYIITLNK